MAKYFSLWRCVGILFFLFFGSLHSQDSSKISHRVFLIANTTDISLQSTFLTATQQLLASTNETFSFIINGDLVPKKITKKKSEIYHHKIEQLLTAISKFKQGRIFIIPGDRDWADSEKDGWDDVKKLEKWIKDFNYDNVTWAIKNGCPGPKLINLTPTIDLLAINTQWWNHPYEKPGPSDADCKISTTDDFKEELEDIIDDEKGKNLLIAGHFPIVSLGEYGGNFSLKSHLFPLTEIMDYFYLPLPLIGSIYPSYRKNVGTSKDISNEYFESFRSLLGNTISYRQSLIYVSGHEHNLQINKKDNNYFINSGSPTNPDYTSDDHDALFSKSVPGLIELVYFQNGKINSNVHIFSEAKGFYADEKYELFQSACDIRDTNIPANDRFIPCEEEMSVATSMTGSYPDSVETIAGPEYSAGLTHRFFFGDHYRDTWTAPVTVPSLDLDTTFGGLVPLKKGGGRQTKSLKFMAGNGMRYTFRSVNKDPIKALDYELRETIVVKVVRDQTTTQNPYGAMAADVMLNELGIFHAHPKLYQLPKDDKLGIYKKEYGNLLGMLEENPTNPEKDETGYAGADEIIRSHKLFRRLYQSNKNRVDSRNFAIARCFDILVGDWGKHEDNWKWVGFKENGRILYKPMPRDRDHVFSRWDGILPWLADREWAKPSGEDFDYDIVGLRSLMWQARHLDRFVAADLDKKDWIQAAKFVQKNITDEVIGRAIRNMPKEVYQVSGKEIESKLKQRIRDLEKYATEYYKMLASEVDVIGSNEKEYFKASRNSDGTVKVSVTNLKKSEKPGDYVFYERIFIPEETDEIRLFGLGGSDVFKISGESSVSIPIRVIGGPGADKIYDTSRGDKTYIYEKNKKADIKMGAESVRKSPSDESVYKYNRTSFAYNTYLPLLYLYYNSDQKFILGYGLEFTTQRFGAKDYSTKHNISGKISAGNTFSIGYELRIHHVLGQWDFILGGTYANPKDYLYFYGLGNETSNDQEANFYKTRYKSFQIQSGFIYDFWKRSSFSGIIYYDNNESQLDRENTIMADSKYFGMDSLHFSGVDVRLDLDFRDNSNLPEDGMRIYIAHQNGFMLSDDNSNYGKTFSFLEYYTSVLPFTLGIKAGGGNSYGNIPFYNQFSLGQNTNLRGYRNYRFTGKAMAFLNSELRIHLFEMKTVLLPIKIGLKGFYDTGRIFQHGEDSEKWHAGYGAGLYVIPLESSFTLSVSAGFSDEESLLLTFGLGGGF